MRSKQIAERVLGGSIEPGTGPILVSIVTGVTAQYAFYGFFALFALRRVGMDESSVGLALLCSSLTGTLVGFVGGRLSDAIGRRPLVIASTAAQLPLPLLLVQPHVGPTLAVAVLVAMTVVGPLRMAPLFALVIDVVPEERRERTFATNRIAFNVAALTGPLLGAGLVALDWRALHVGVTVLGVLTFLAALRLPSPHHARPSAGQALSFAMFGDLRFLLLFCAGFAAMLTYNAFETLLPVSLTQSHGLAPSQWGLLFVVNPIVVMLLQLRVTRWTARVPAAVKLPVALLVMGFSFLPLLVSASLPVLIVILLVFVAGEMLWAPTADALVGRVAPESARGAFMGTLGVAAGAGVALSPAIGLHVRAAQGDAAMWLVVGAISIGAAALYALTAYVHSPARTGSRSRFAGGASGQTQRGSYAHEGL
jgi:predicted MFS family arabinose efflux permease